MIELSPVSISGFVYADDDDDGERDSVEDGISGVKLELLDSAGRGAGITTTTDADGRMSFRTHLPLSRARASGSAAADGQMGCLVKLYRDWQLSGDDAMLPGILSNWEVCASLAAACDSTARALTSCEFNSPSC